MERRTVSRSKSFIEAKAFSIFAAMISLMDPTISLPLPVKDSRYILLSPSYRSSDDQLFLFQRPNLSRKRRDVHADSFSHRLHRWFSSVMKFRKELSFERQ